MCWKVGPSSSFRASYNIATTGPTSLQQYIDFPVSTVQPAVFDVWLSGQNDVQTINPNGNNGNEEFENVKLITLQETRDQLTLANSPLTYAGN